MLTNFHTHSTFCDGSDTPEQMVQAAIEKGFSALGFSGHGYLDFDQSYCMTDTKAYMAEINRLKEAYKDKIQIYLGIEEDMLYTVANREEFDYIIGSLHYVFVNGTPYALDISNDKFLAALNEFGGDILALAENYYSQFCYYIKQRKPDIIGHFDVLTKYDEKFDYGFATNQKYIKLAKKYIKKAARAGSFFEVNTGAIARGWRTMPYPAEELLFEIKKQCGRVVLNSDCHKKENLDCHFTEAKKWLKDIGFDGIYYLNHGEWQKDIL